MADHVLDLIDNVVEEYELLSADAMRWAPDAPDPTPAAGHLAIVVDPILFLASDVQAWAEHNGVVLNEWQRDVLVAAFASTPLVTYAYATRPLARGLGINPETETQ